jgi:hypothetical protein
MNLKKDDCLLIFAPNNLQGELLVREILKTGKKVRLATSDLKSTKRIFFDILEKFDSIREISFTSSSDFSLEELNRIKNGTLPTHLIFISSNDDVIYNREAFYFYYAYKIMFFFGKQKNIKKFIFINLKNFDTKPDPNVYIKGNNNLEIIKIIRRIFEKNDNSKYHMIPIQRFYNNLLELMLKFSKMNYLIIQTGNFYKKDKIINNEENTFDIENFSNIIKKTVENKIFKKNSVYKMDQKSYSDLKSLYSPPVVHEFYNYYFKVNFLRKKSFENSDIYFKFNVQQDYYLSYGLYTILSFGIINKLFSIYLKSKL